MIVNTSLIAIIHPLWPADSAQATAPGSPLLAWIGLALALLLLVSGAISYYAWRDRKRSAPVDRAFRVMARRLRMGRPAMELLRALAEDRDLPPVALLLSECAFDRAASTSTRHLDPDALAAVRHHLFGEH